MIPRSTDGKTRALSLSYGKDSMACLGAIELLGWPLDRIVTADVWATNEIEAELPEMVSFKKYADKEIFSRYGIKVEHFRSKYCYEERFREKVKPDKRRNADFPDRIRGFPFMRGSWCLRDLKQLAMKAANSATKGAINYLGIAADEPNRFGQLNDVLVSPLVEIGWTEQDCRNWCVENGLLSPIYSSTARGGCWFCHKQPIGQLRQLRKEHPELWKILREWDSASPVPFRADGHTVRDLDKRFAMEDDGLVDPHGLFRWKMLGEELNYNIILRSCDGTD